MISVTVDGSPRAIPVTVDTGSPHTFIPASAVRRPRGAQPASYLMAGKRWNGWMAPLRIKLAEGAEFTVPEAFIAKNATFGVIGTDILQGLGCRVNLKTHKLVCPPSVSIPMFEPPERGPVKRAGRTGLARRRRSSKR